KQFKKYYVAADKKEGITGENLLSLLERRFDNVVYRMGLASSRKEARQLVRHTHFTLNGKKADIPSIILKVGDVVALKDKSRSSEKIKGLMENMANTNAPKWLELNVEAASAKVIAIPAREDVDFDFNEQLIVEFYSK
ncbi:MAG: 30S ribosomal protein S4, partial [Clostridia bacterium]|nr:30S ribosomal protein S4 [Clostridia bacterium]